MKSQLNAVLLSGAVIALSACSPKEPVPLRPLSDDEAFKLVARTIQERHLATLPESCIGLSGKFEVDNPDPISVEAWEIHNATCRGDPATSPRLFTITVDRRTRSMTLESADGERRKL